MSGTPTGDTATTLTADRGVATVTLNRPGSRNALSAELVDSLGDDLRTATEDGEVRVIVVTNAGPAFCAGADLRSTSDRPPRWSLVEVLEMIIDGPKPVVGRIAGHCVGGGVGLAAACDLSVVVDDAHIGFSEVRIGVAPAIISVVCLPKMRRADASELFLSGERVSAARAVEVGLLNRVVPRGQLDATVEELVSGLMAGGPNALAASKRLIREVPRLGRSEAFAMTEHLSGELFASDEAAEGIAAFREKRPARWVR